jgi:hypothetical protein
MDKVVLYEANIKKNILKNFKNTCPIKLPKELNKSKYGRFIPLNEENISEEDAKKYYTDKTKALTIIQSSVSVVREGSKVSIRFSRTERIRVVGATFFKVRRVYKFVTYNLKTKNFYYGNIRRKNKKLLNKKIRCNFFSHLFLTDIKFLIRKNFNSFDLKILDWKELISADTEYRTKGDETSMTALKIFSYEIYKYNKIMFNYKSNFLEDELFKLYLQDNGIAYPDAISQYVNIFFPKKILLKHKNIVHSIIKINELKGRYIRKILNQGENINIKNLLEIYHNFGVDYFNNIRESFFSNLHEMRDDTLFKVSDFKTNVNNYNLTLVDKKRIVNLINSDSSMSWGIIKNHLSMIKELEKYNHKFKMRFINRDSFNNEHYELTELLSKYTEGIITRVYGDKFKDTIEEPIMGLMVDFYPVLLTTSAQYNDESQVQSNCVITYLDIAKSIIVSLREGSSNSNNRITVEYLIRKNSLERIQTRGRFNCEVGEMWKTPLEILDNRMELSYKTKEFKLPVMFKEYSNGRVVENRAVFNEQNNYFSDIPKWVNEETIHNREVLELPF